MGNLIRLNDRILISTIKQKLDSVDFLVNHTYLKSVENCDSLNSLIPPFCVRFVKWFSEGKTKEMEKVEDCHLNSYKLMWTLRELNSPLFNKHALRFHNSKLPRWRRNYDIYRFREKYEEPVYKVIELSKSYESISNIDLENEPELAKHFSNLDSCKLLLLENSKSAIADINCGYTGRKILLRLSENKIRLGILEDWIS